MADASRPETGPLMVRGAGRQGVSMIPVLCVFLGSAALACTSSGPSSSRRSTPTKVPILSFDYLDENGDASVDGVEFQKLATAMFNRLDEDKDGRLSEDEYMRLTERPQLGGDGKGGGRRGGGRRGY